VLVALAQEVQVVMAAAAMAAMKVLVMTLLGLLIQVAVAVEPAPLNQQAMVALVRKIANREGIGDLLAEGVMRAAASIGKGAEAFAIHVKGLELPAYEPRGAKTQGFNYATSNIGASHCYGYSGQDVFGAIVPRPSDRFAEHLLETTFGSRNDQRPLFQPRELWSHWRACGQILVPAPIFTGPSITAYGPISTSGAIWAVGSTTAVG